MQEEYNNLKLLIKQRKIKTNDEILDEEFEKSYLEGVLKDE